MTSKLSVEFLANCVSLVTASVPYSNNQHAHANSNHQAVAVAVTLVFQQLPPDSHQVPIADCL